MLCGSSLRAGIIVLYRSCHYSGPTSILARKPSDESARGWINPKISGNNGMAGVGNFAASQNRERRGRTEVYGLLWLGDSRRGKSERSTEKKCGDTCRAVGWSRNAGPDRSHLGDTKFPPEKSSNNLFIPVWKQLRGQSLRRKIYAPLAGMRIVRIPAQQTSACLIWDAPVPRGAASLSRTTTPEETS